MISLYSNTSVSQAFVFTFGFAYLYWHIFLKGRCVCFPGAIRNELLCVFSKDHPSLTY